MFQHFFIFFCDFDDFDDFGAVAHLGEWHDVKVILTSVLVCAGNEKNLLLFFFIIKYQLYFLLYLCSRFLVCRRFGSVIKRESGVNPEQTRCCISR